MSNPDLPTVSRLAQQVLDEVEIAVIGKRHALVLVLSSILAGGHVLIEDMPGLGKTLAARSFAQTLGLKFKRAQFTPDLLPADLSGSFVYDQRSGEFVFRPGPLFTGLLLADEINRTPPKTQAALLEAMQERQISVEGQTFPLEAPFHVLATANPVEYEGTYPLPEAQLDRFLMRVSFGYPDRDDEWEVLRRRMDRRQEEQTLRTVTDAATLLGMQAAVETVTVDASVSRLLRRPGDRDPSPPARNDRRVTARVAGVDVDCAFVRRDLGTRLRNARRREGGGARRHGAPHHGAARTVDECCVRGHRHGRGAVVGANPVGARARQPGNVSRRR